jgi:hypothetical protein
MLLVGPPGFEPGSRTSEAQSLDHTSRRSLRILSCIRFYISVLLEGFLVVNKRISIHIGFCESEIFNVNSEAFYVTPLVCGYESPV